ncbi:MAG: M20/M25/M40 family metallo-hydrolase [Melioribacteraceae bacterium]
MNINNKTPKSLNTIKWFLSFPFIVSLLATNISLSQTVPINSNELLKTVTYLSSADLQGRMPGHVGYEKAANFMVKELESLHLKSYMKEGYKQKLFVEYNEIKSPSVFNIITSNGNKIKYKLGEDFVFRGFTGSDKFSAEVVFAGYGISQPEKGYDDYSGIDVNGKVVLVFKYNPSWKIGEVPFDNGNPREKTQVAKEHGAVGVLMVSLPNDINPQVPIGSLINGKGEQLLDMPQIHINLPVAEKLFQGSNTTLKAMQSIIDSLKNPHSIPLLNKVEIDVTAEYTREAETWNISGIIEGSDPMLRNEYIVLGAHLDHVGQQGGGEIYFPGANDNASGSAAVLEIARALSKLENKPKRSIIIVFFASEEQGLNGSTFFANNLNVPKENVKAMFNMDCVGYGDSIQIGGGLDNKEMWDLARSIDNENDQLMIGTTWKGGGADSEPFYQIGIKTLYFVTTNSYAHLHKLSDKVETLNPKLFEAITKLAYKTLFEAANL